MALYTRGSTLYEPTSQYGDLNILWNSLDRSRLSCTLISSLFSGLRHWSCVTQIPSSNPSETLVKSHWRDFFIYYKNISLLPRYFEPPYSLHFSLKTLYGIYPGIIFINYFVLLFILSHIIRIFFMYRKGFSLLLLNRVLFTVRERVKKNEIWFWKLCKMPDYVA